MNENHTRSYALLTSLVIIFSHCYKPVQFAQKNPRVKPDKSCYQEINQQMLNVIHNPEHLVAYLQIDSTEAKIISDSADLIPKERREALIVKLIDLITDTTMVLFACGNSYAAKIYFGDIALLSIYKLEPFPFAAALQRQWCTGNPMAEDIYLPDNLIEYTSFDRPAIQEAYREYFIGRREQG